jgi:TetR/AcrR family transcriptional regulator, regulator of biofilm formation and stress response
VTRRHDPERRERILDAALRVVAERGVPRTTHRAVAAAADVPLGSLTYHFTGLDDLLRQAFARHAARLATAYAARVDGVGDRAGLVDAVTDLVCADADADQDDWAIAYALYAAALQDPALRTVTQEWMDASRAALTRYVDPLTAHGVDALVEGLVMHRMLATRPLPRADVRLLVERAVRP